MNIIYVIVIVFKCISAYAQNITLVIINNNLPLMICCEIIVNVSLFILFFIMISFKFEV